VNGYQNPVIRNRHCQLSQNTCKFQLPHCLKFDLTGRLFHFVLFPVYVQGLFGSPALFRRASSALLLARRKGL
jgi:hypothetical protein